MRHPKAQFHDDARLAKSAQADFVLLLLWFQPPVEIVTCAIGQAPTPGCAPSLAASHPVFLVQQVAELVDPNRALR